MTDFHSLCKRRQTRAASSFSSQKYSLLQAFVGRGMQLPEKYKEKYFDVSSEGPLSKFSSYFSGCCIATNEKKILLALPRQFKII